MRIENEALRIAIAQISYIRIYEEPYDWTNNVREQFIVKITMLTIFGIILVMLQMI